jgi:hypothetical protein
MIQHNVQWKETELIISPVNFFEECRWRETLAPHLPNLKKNERARRSRQRRRNGAPSVKTQLKEELDAASSQPARSPTVTYDDEGKPEGLNFHEF